MARLARRGLKVQLILPGKSDVFLPHLAALLKAFIPALCGLASRRIGPKRGWRAGFWRIWTLTSPTNFLTWDKS